MGQDAAGQLLLALFLLLAVTCLVALLRVPLGNFTILEEGRFAVTFHLVELATDLLQGTQLSLKVDIIATARLHLLHQIPPLSDDDSHRRPYPRWTLAGMVLPTGPHPTIAFLLIWTQYPAQQLLGPCLLVPGPYPLWLDI